MDYGKSVSSLNPRGLSNARDSLSGTGKASLSLTLSNGTRASIKPYEPTMISFPKEAKYDPAKDNRFTDVVKKYFIETSIHGLKYICENKRHAVERIFWFIAVLTLTCCGGYLIYQIINKWQTSPVLVSFDTQVTPISEIPFPAFTICNFNKVRKSRAELVESKRQADPFNELWQKEHLFIQDVCESHLEEEKAEKTSENDLEIDGHLLHEFLEELAQPCDNLLLRCHFAGLERDCSKIFSPVITDNGQCCTFNMMPEEILFRDEVLEDDVEINENLTKRWKGWDINNGYSEPAYIPVIEDLKETEKILENEPLPRRVIAAGLHAGLTVALNVEKDEYYCSGSESVGFKGLFHMPSTSPEMVEYGFAISPGTENFISILADVLHSSQDINKISIEKRGCYLDGEKDLRFYKNYAYLNCFMECAANHTFDECGCVAYHMPRDSNTMPICSPSKHKCVEKAVGIVEQTAFDVTGTHIKPLIGHPTMQSKMDLLGTIGAECACLPSCTEFKFAHSMTQGVLSNAKSLKFKSSLTEAIPDLTDDLFVRENIAIIHIYHENLHFLKHERGELFSTVDLLSYIGGVLGLCLGFSAMSALECIYFFTLRLGLNIRMKRSEHDV